MGNFVLIASLVMIASCGLVFLASLAGMRKQMVKSYKLQQDIESRQRALGDKLEETEGGNNPRSNDVLPDTATE